MARPSRTSRAVFPLSAPQYELHVRSRGPGRTEYEIWQLPAVATPQVKRPVRVAGLRGRNLDLVEHRVLRRLARGGVKLLSRTTGERRAYPLSEDLALSVGLLFRCLAPMRHRDRMIAVAEGVDAMEREEAGYWLGMAMHRRNPRRVLMALRCLLTEAGGR